MTGHDENGDEGGRSGRRPGVPKASGLLLAGALVLGPATAAWAYWHLNHDVRGVAIDSALGDDRPARAAATASAPASAGASARCPPERRTSWSYSPTPRRSSGSPTPPVSRRTPAWTAPAELTRFGRSLRRTACGR
ncbi:hypothetical protein ACFQ9Z_23145 [Streptomyces sp. NPDC056580]|uniref:hypothetical protein n=1 Tax=Streptomyces sp. NPDC056580 TaxID=3345872 RepID=UPI0036CCF2DF